jgi:small subunit ribosomal protein S1
LDSSISDSAPAQEESFAQLLEQSKDHSKRLSPGEKITAQVISVSGDTVFIDLGGKTEGVIALSEILDDKGVPAVSPGDTIEAFFVTVEDGIRRFTTLIHGYPAVRLSAIRNAFEGGVPVQGEVRREVKGGFEVSAGGVRCFCPFSQIDMKGGREGGVYLGQTFPFKVLKFEEEGRNIILSRRVLLEQEKRAQIEKLKETLTVGMEVTAPVSSVQSFGVFVDLGGTDALIPASEMSWGRVENPQEHFSVGQQVTAKAISLDWASNRLTLSLKALLPDPWSNAADRYPIDSVVKGTIVRLAPFGAFVSLEPGIDGMVHISNLGAGRRINHPKEVVEVGQEVEAYVLAVDGQNRKISLSLQPKAKPKKLDLPAEGAVVNGAVERVMPFGVFLKMTSGVTGLIPNSEMGTARGTDHSRMFPVGTPIQAVVLEVDHEQGRVSLSRRGVVEREEQDEFDRYRDKVSTETKSQPLGILGEKLKAKLDERQLGG